LTAGLDSDVAAPVVSPAVAFFSAVRARFQDAAARAGVLERAFQIGSRVALLRFAGSALHDLLTPALDHLTLPAGTLADLAVDLFDSASTGVAGPRPVWGASSFGPRGEIEGFNTPRIRTVFQQGADTLLMLDRQRSEALYWISDSRKVPYWERSFPLRMTFHWWLEDFNLQPVHAAAVGLAGGGVLIAGRSGSGKSTAALACLDSELQYAGDDYVLAGHSPPYVYSLYSTAKLEPSNLERLPHWQTLVANPGRLDREKALIYLNSCAPGKLIHGFPIRAILIPRITGRRDTALNSASAGEAFLALAPTTLFHLPGADRETFAKISGLVRQVPAYRLEAGTDLAQIPQTILGLLKSLERA
jgi:hypothetical protein